MKICHTFLFQMTFHYYASVQHCANTQSFSNNNLGLILLVQGVHDCHLDNFQPSGLLQLWLYVLN